MKIALMIEHFDALRSGAGHMAVWLAAELSRRGNDVHVICHDVRLRVSRFRQATLRASHDAARSHRAHHDTADASYDGITVHRLRGMRLQSAMGYRLFGARARQVLKRLRPDVVHSFTVACPGDVYHAYSGVLAALHERAEASRSMPGASPLKRMLLRFPGKQRTLLARERSAVDGAGFVVSPCEMTTRQLMDAYGMPRQRIVQLSVPLLEPPTDASAESRAESRRWFRAHYRIQESDRTAIFVGHDFRRKGLRYAIEAVARTRDWRLLVVGLGKTRPYVELADRLGIGPASGVEARVLFVGPTSEMDAAYAAADALLLPAFYEPSNLVALEALSHGLPVVATEFLGSADLVMKHKVGTIVPEPTDIAALARALEALPAPGTPARSALAARARKASQVISPEDFVDALLKLYGQVARG